MQMFLNAIHCQENKQICKFFEINLQWMKFLSIILHMFLVSLLMFFLQKTYIMILASKCQAPSVGTFIALLIEGPKIYIRPRNAVWLKNVLVKSLFFCVKWSKKGIADVKVCINSSHKRKGKIIKFDHN